jgi:NAD(P) transhydrogenase subunit alpha
MKIAVPKETHADETRVALSLDTAKKLLQLKADVTIEKGLATSLSIEDKKYLDLGVKVEPNRQELFSQADILLCVRKPKIEEIAWLKKGAILISFLDPFNEKDLIVALQKQGVTSVSMEMIPRTTLAQKMDALSSQANLAGYVAVIEAAAHLKKVFPMMTTPSGTISPVRVFVIGAGVAGLQAIATAKRLGARVEAFDTRTVVEEQVKSLGAKFVKVDLGETGQTKDGYAKQLTADQLEKQRLAMKKVCENSDIVITTAQVFGKKAPLIITKEMVESMQPGSVIVDMAVETGGNVEGSKVNSTETINGVDIIGLANLPGKVALDATQMYAANLFHLLNHFWDKEEFRLDLENDLLKSSVITHEGVIFNDLIKNKFTQEN